jgi:hypothetical protein
VIAIARHILEIVYLLINDPGLRFHDLGADYYTGLNPARRSRAPTDRRRPEDRGGSAWLP